MLRFRPIPFSLLLSYLFIHFEFWIHTKWLTINCRKFLFNRCRFNSFLLIFCYRWCNVDYLEAHIYTLCIIFLFDIFCVSVCFLPWNLSICLYYVCVRVVCNASVRRVLLLNSFAFQWFVVCCLSFYHHTFIYFLFLMVSILLWFHLNFHQYFISLYVYNILIFSWFRCNISLNFHHSKTYKLKIKYFSSTHTEQYCVYAEN